MRVEKEGLSAVQVGTVGVNPVTAWWLLRGFRALRGGEWVVLNGANGGVGRGVLQLGRRWGVRCLAVVRGRGGQEGERLRGELEALGAERVVGEEEVAGRGFGEKVKEWTGGEGIRLGLNCVGGEAGMAMAKMLSPGGVMVTYGGMSGKPMRVGAGMLIFKDLKFEGFWVSRWSEGHPEEKRRTVDALLEMMRKGEFRDGPVVEVPWGWGTEKRSLVDAVQGTLEGYRKGKGVFVFGDM